MNAINVSCLAFEAFIILCTFAVIPISVLSFNYINRIGTNRDEAAAHRFVQEYNEEGSQKCSEATKARWYHSLYPTLANQQKMQEAQKKAGAFERKAWKRVTSFEWDKFVDSTQRRWFRRASLFEDVLLKKDKLMALKRAVREMTDNYDNTLFCDYRAPKDTKEMCTLKFIPSVNSKLGNLSLSYEERLFYWKQFHNKVGAKNKEPFAEYVGLSNEAAALNGFKDRGDQWRGEFERKDFENICLQLYQQIKPLFLEIHAYVRSRLVQAYPDYVSSEGPIPAHLLGGMSGQSWRSLLPLVRPYPKSPSFDCTTNMVQQNYTINDMVNAADKFFRSLGLKPVSSRFYNDSVFENKPSAGMKLNCMATSWDLCDGKDFRIKMCTEISMSHLVTIHHEMGHIQYYMQYAEQPKGFRDAPNPAFHEAIGDIISLSVQTPTYLKQIGLLSEGQAMIDKESRINFLMGMALEKVPFLPSALILDLWRWRVFRGDIGLDEMNWKWWEMRLDYQGLCPGSRRTEDHLDPLAKFHVANGSPFISYFISYIIQFQFHKELCRISGHSGPLFLCSIYNSRKAGDKLREILKLGASKSATTAFKVLTNGRSDRIDAAPLLEYFEPLYEWLRNENRNESLGWDSINPMLCPWVDVAKRKRMQDNEEEKNSEVDVDEDEDEGEDDQVDR